VRLDPTQQAALDEAVRLFNAGDYFECHEVLEKPWLAAGEPAKTFLKGLIHAAVALHHYRRGNSHGARVKAASARRYLEPYLPAAAGLDLAALLRDLDAFLAPLHARPALPPPPQRCWPLIGPKLPEL